MGGVQGLLLAVSSLMHSWSDWSLGSKVLPITHPSCSYLWGTYNGLGSLEMPLIPETGKGAPRVQSPGLDVPNLFSDPLRAQTLS